MIRLQNLLKMSSRRICETSWRRFEDVLKMSWRRLEDDFARRLENVLKTSWRRYSKTSWRPLENILKTSWRRMDKTNILVLSKDKLVFMKTSWRRLEDVLRRGRRKTSSSRRMFAGFSFHPVYVILLARSWLCLSKNIITYLVWGMRFFAMVRFQSLSEVSK